MNPRHLTAMALAGILSAGPANAATTLTEFGSLATISSGTCASDYCGDDTDIGFFLSLSVDPIVGGNGVASASAATGPWAPPHAVDTALASGTVAGGLAVPVVTAGAATVTPNQWLGSQALVVQGYSYNGPGETLSLGWNLSGTISNPDSDTLTGLAVFVGFFSTAEFTYPELDPGNPLGIVGLLAALALANPDDNFIEHFSDAGLPDSGTISIDVVNGDEFYLAMGLNAGAGGAGAIADSLSTLTGEFDGNPLLTPVITAVPLPPALPMLLGALGGLLFSRRRRGSRAGAA